MTVFPKRNKHNACTGFWLCLALVVWLLVPASCGRTGGGDSESHFLASCDGKTVCGPGLACLCGVCSEPCDDDLDCGVPGASCRDPSESECRGSAPVSLCDVDCTAEIDCEALGDFVCPRGQCRARGSAPATGGSGGTSGVPPAPNGGSSAQQGGSTTGGIVTGGETGATGATGADGGAPQVLIAGAAGFAGSVGGSAGDNPGVVAAGSGNVGPLSNEACSMFTDATSCEASGCNPVLSDSRILRISSEAGSGGTAGSSDCTGTGGSSFYLGCTLGAGGAIALCYCAEDDPSRCLWAEPELGNVESIWRPGNCGECVF